MSFSINNKLRFIDSLQFLRSSLDSLVKTWWFRKDNFKHLSEEFDINVLDLVKEKGFYPYEYMSKFKKFKEELSSTEKFYSSLTGKKIRDKEYQHVLKVWNKSEMKIMKDFYDLYLKCEVLLLADVFEKFRKNKKFRNLEKSLKNYVLCPSHYLRPPALSWDAILNMTKVKLEIISNTDMYIFFEKGMRGGVSYIPDRYSKENNKYLKSCDTKQESKHIIYLDTNNLYGYAMSKFLPTSGFKWIDPKEFDLNKYSSNSWKGCVLEVGLEYPKELWELHNDYPLAPDKIEIKREKFSNYQLKIADHYNIPISNVKKLVSNSFDEEKYMTHHENLKLYRRIGLKLRQIYRVLEFNQS